jgi:predicted nucleotidyltransferase
MQQALSALLGREVDIKTPGFISASFRQRIINTAEALYNSL